MQNKDLVSCCLTYGANAKTATLPYLSLLESESERKCKVNVKKVILPIQKMLYASLGCYISLRTYVPTQSLFSGNTLSYSFSRAPKQFGLVCYTKFLLVVTCMLLRVRRLNLLNNLASSYLQSVSLMLDHLQPTMSVSLCYLLVFLSANKV